MVAYITYYNEASDDDLVVSRGPQNVQWHVGTDTAGINSLARTSGKTVTCVQADGHELEHIVTNIAGIPHAKHKRTTIWRGSMARFIAEHL